VRLVPSHTQWVPGGHGALRRRRGTGHHHHAPITAERAANPIQHRRPDLLRIVVGNVTVACAAHPCPSGYTSTATIEPMPRSEANHPSLASNNGAGPYT